MSESGKQGQGVAKGLPYLHVRLPVTDSCQGQKKIHVSQFPLWLGAATAWLEVSRLPEEGVCPRTGLISLELKYISGSGPVRVRAQGAVRHSIQTMIIQFRKKASLG